jgi:hypothetical protein
MDLEGVRPGSQVMFLYTRDKVANINDTIAGDVDVVDVKIRAKRWKTGS